MASNGMGSFQVSLLKGNTYDNWSIKIKALLGAHDVWEIVGKCYKELQDGNFLTQRLILKTSKNRDKKALFFIYQALEENEFEKISNATFSNEA